MIRCHGNDLCEFIQNGLIYFIHLHHDVKNLHRLFIESQYGSNVSVSKSKADLNSQTMNLIFSFINIMMWRIFIGLFIESQYGSNKSVSKSKADMNSQTMITFIFIESSSIDDRTHNDITINSQWTRKAIDMKSRRDHNESHWFHQRTHNAITTWPHWITSISNMNSHWHRNACFLRRSCSPRPRVCGVGVDCAINDTNCCTQASLLPR
jgi:hypothetical protein